MDGLPHLPNPHSQSPMRGVEIYLVDTIRYAGSWRRTQVVKGAVCKTAIHRFESGRRLITFPHYAARFLFFCVFRRQLRQAFT